MKIEESESLLKEIFTRVPDESEGDPERRETCLPNIYKAFNGKVIILEYFGSIGLPCIDRFYKSLHSALTGESEQVVLSMSNVVKLSRSAIGVVVDFAAGVLGRGKELYIFQPHPEVRQKMDGMLLNGFFKTLHTEEELISILPVEYLHNF